MEIYRTNNRNIFYTITKIDNKKSISRYIKNKI